MSESRRCERCGAEILGDDYLCDSCRADCWETRYENNQCGNCQGYLGPGDKYCRLCGTKAGEGSFKPWQNFMECVYGPMPVLRKHECSRCGHTWETMLMIDNQRFCPECGGLDKGAVCEN